MSKKVKTVTEEVINDEVLGEFDVKDRKAERFFNFFKKEENYVIYLYKVKERGKAELVEKYESEVPDLLRVRDIWGGGTYKLYAHNFDNELIDTTVVHVASPPEGKNLSHYDNEEAVLQKALKYRELFGQGTGNNEIMLKVIEMQAQFTQSINSLVSKMNEKNLESQIAMERRFVDMIESLQSKKNGFGDLIQAAEFINMIKGDGGEVSLLDKIISNPIFQNIAGQFISTASHTGHAVHTGHAKQLPKVTVDGSAKKDSEIPQEFIDKITLENRHLGIENVIKAYKIPRDRAETIVDSILKSKGLIQ